jgi:hypothetical protein
MKSKIPLTLIYFFLLFVPTFLPFLYFGKTIPDDLERALLFFSMRPLLGFELAGAEVLSLSTSISERIN